MRLAPRAHGQTFLHPRGYRRLALSRLWIRRDFAGRGVRLAAPIIGEAQRAVNRSGTCPDKKLLRKLEAPPALISDFWREFGLVFFHPADIPWSEFGTPIAIAYVFERERHEAESPAKRKGCSESNGQKQRRKQARHPSGRLQIMGPFWEASDWPLRAEGHLSGRGDGPKALSYALWCAPRCACVTTPSRV